MFIALGYGNLRQLVQCPRQSWETSLQRTKIIFRFVCFALGLCISGCVTDPKSDPEAPGEPELVHTGKDLVLIPNVRSSESLYVMNSKPREWQVALLAAPPGTLLGSDSKVYYNIP